MANRYLESIHNTLLANELLLKSIGVSKAPPGPKPKRFGEEVEFDEQARRWKCPIEGCKKKGSHKHSRRPRIAVTGDLRGTGFKEARRKLKGFVAENQPAYYNMPDNTYTEESYFGLGYEPINHYLNGGMSSLDPIHYSELVKIESNMKAIETPHTVYRGMDPGTIDNPAVRKMWQNMKAGDMLPVDAFMSTSRDPLVVFDYFDGRTMLLDIRPDSKAECMVLSDKDAWMGEAETLFNYGHSLVIDQVRRNIKINKFDVKMYVIGRLIPKASVAQVAKAILKAPPGPKPKRFGEEVEFDEQARRWKCPIEGCKKKGSHKHSRRPREEVTSDLRGEGFHEARRKLRGFKAEDHPTYYDMSDDAGSEESYFSLGYEPINHYLNGGIDNLHSAFKDELVKIESNMKPIEIPHTAYRGMNPGTMHNPAVKKMWQGMKAGDMLSVDAFMSTTRDPLIALDDFAGETMLLDIRPDPKAECMVLSDDDTLMGEEETLFNYGQSFVVDKVHRNIKIYKYNVGVYAIGRLIPKASVATVAKAILKAPPGPKPGHFGEKVEFDEQARRWKCPIGGCDQKGEHEHQQPAGRAVSEHQWRLPPKLKNKKGEKVPITWDKQPLEAGVTDWWVNEDKKSYLQAVGLSAQGRRVYRYSLKFKTDRAKAKYVKNREFTKAVSRLRRRVGKDIKNSEEAAVIYMIDKTAFRVGGREEKSIKGIKAYGATTLLRKHVDVKGNTVLFDFIGKHGVHITKSVTDRRLAQIIRKRVKSVKDPEGGLFNTNESRVLRYMQRATGDSFTPKNFRTYHATKIAKDVIKNRPDPTTVKEFKMIKKEACEKASVMLGNSPAMALGSYIDPAVIKRLERKVKK